MTAKKKKRVYSNQKLVFVKKKNIYLKTKTEPEVTASNQTCWLVLIQGCQIWKQTSWLDMRQMGQIWDFWKWFSVHFGSASNNLSNVVLIWPVLGQIWYPCSNTWISVWPKIRPDWHQMGQIWGFYCLAFDPFGFDLVQFCVQTDSPFVITSRRGSKGQSVRPPRE